MAERDEQTSAEADSEAVAARIVRLFDADRAGAVARFRQLGTDKGQAGKVLLQLNKLDRHDIVVIVTEAVSLDGKTAESVIVERARALAATGAPLLAEQLLSRMSVSRKRDYAFQYSAGRVLGDARLHRQALGYFESAFAARPTAQAAERVFLSHLALENYRDAARAMARIVRAGTYRDVLAKDFAFLLQHIEPGELDPELAFTLAALPGTDETVAPALLPHLIAADMLDCVSAAVDRGIVKFAGWNDAVLLSVVPYLARRGQFDRLLRVHDQYDGNSAAVADAFGDVLGGMPTEQMIQFLSPDMSGFLEHGASSGDAMAYRDASRHFARTADAEAGLQMLQLLPALIAPEDAQRFYGREKSRLARLAILVAEKLGRRADVMEALTRFVAHWVEPPVARFFAGPDAERLGTAVAAMKRIETAPRNSRLARLREGYFGFYLQRRADLDFDSLTNDFQLCEVALEYFSTLAGHRPVAAVPVGEALSARLGRPTQSLGTGRPFDVLTSCVIVMSRPALPLAQSNGYDEFCWWYVTGLAGDCKIPPRCLQPEIVAHLNEAVLDDGFSGLDVTRFLKLAWSKSDAHRRKFDLGNFVDRVLFVIDLIASLLPRHTQYFPLFRPFLAPERDDGRPSLLGLVLAALTGTGRSASGDPRRATLLEAAAGAVGVRPAARAGDAPQDILLIGHASKDTGLGRNFAMLAEGLTTERTALTGLDFDAHVETINEELARWHENCRSNPIVVFAVNAHDVPEIFVEDRNGILLDCYSAGFFLWEVSRVPQVQELGVTLVDEVWAPTAYVAEIYATLAATHVVGKGLFRGDEAYLDSARPERTGAAFKFATVFDFDSSIERKNPLAAVLAFQKAFRSGENVELTVKTSNVNPQHWSNAAGHWERLAASCAGDRRIKLVTARYSADEMTALVRDADCVVSLHRSEGFGYLIADAMAFGTPVIATDYSGNADFCDAGTAFPVPYRLVAVPPGAARWRCDGAQWADADIDAAAARMQSVFENYANALEVAQRARRNIRSRYSIEAFKSTLSTRIEAIRAGRR